MKLPLPARVPVTDLEWPQACRLLPARFQAADCFETVLDPRDRVGSDILARLFELTAASQAFAASLRKAGSKGIIYASVRRPGGSCLAAFDPNTLRVCRHDTYLGFRWDGLAVARVVEKRILTLQPPAAATPAAPR